ncbi:hypothetical protein [Methylicorpusculum sp.]|uniref:hypothetical protein n=1 Tax=Methylicorpusculum sp. TaxID=2713644 RepID=UPI0027309FFC|nr:hypothetical protein [Methylicorpusculum sp.]MDP2180377.1 hypothetical protein [Methylicorpusculum sp.]MDP3530747.1 hypothetical protein [Methylicorpusculum sp.]
MFERLVTITTVSIIDDGVIIDPEWANGRPIPAIIVDAKERQDIVEYINAHRTQPPGDVLVQWGTALTSKNKILLIIRSSRPVEIEFAIGFSANKHHALVDGILRNNGFYLLEGKPGDKVSSLMMEDKGRILIEVPATGFEPTWDKILRKTISKIFKQQGLGKKQVENAVKDYLKSMREFWHIRRDS